MADDDRARGLYRKYRVERVDDEPVGACFMLEYGKDPHAAPALAAYAFSCRDEYPHLAADLEALVGEATRSPVFYPATEFDTDSPIVAMAAGVAVLAIPENGDAAVVHSGPHPQAL